MLHFAYGSNMSRTAMRRHAPEAEPVGAATLADYRFAITVDGYASVVPQRAAAVHGVLWRLTPRDCVCLAHWEGLAAGLYRATTLPVNNAGRRWMALVYLARARDTGRAKAGYMELVIAAALEGQLPPDYVASLGRWLPKQPRGAGARERGEFAWT